MNTITHAAFTGAIVLLMGYLTSSVILDNFFFYDWPLALRWQVAGLGLCAWFSTTAVLGISALRRSKSGQRH